MSAVAVDPEYGLTEAESVVMDHLVDAVEAFNALEVQHPQEKAEFFDAIHRCQGLLAVRVCRRVYSEGWPTHADVSGT